MNFSFIRLCNLCFLRNTLRKNFEATTANKYRKPPPKRFLTFLFDALKDRTILILLACTVLFLGFGIKHHGWNNGWYDGGSIVALSSWSFLCQK